MRAVWAIPCRGVVPVGDGTLVLQGAQMDGLAVSALPADLAFWLAIRVVGREDEFREHHDVAATLTGPAFDHLTTLHLPVAPREPPLVHIAGYELNCHLATRVTMTADEAGGYDLSLAVDGTPQHHVRTTISVVRA